MHWQSKTLVSQAGTLCREDVPGRVQGSPGELHLRCSQKVTWTGLKKALHTLHFSPSAIISNNTPFFPFVFEVMGTILIPQASNLPARNNFLMYYLSRYLNVLLPCIPLNALHPCRLK